MPWLETPSLHRYFLNTISLVVDRVLKEGRTVDTRRNSVLEGATTDLGNKYFKFLLFLH